MKCCRGCYNFIPSPRVDDTWEIDLEETFSANLIRFVLDGLYKGFVSNSNYFLTKTWWDSHSYSAFDVFLLADFLSIESLVKACESAVQR